MNGWLQRQSRRRLFFVVWGVFSVFSVSVQIEVTLVLAAHYPGQPYHGPPLWVFPGDVLGSAVPAAVALALKPMKQIQSGPASQVDRRA
jgi:hypothetical protein